MRCTPPAAQLDSFKAFDQGVRACFSSLTGLHPTDAQWQQAARGFDQAGLGLRSTHLDGPAAYLASLGKSRTLCGQLAPSFSNAETLASSHAAAALHLYNGHLPAAQQATLLTSLGQQQKQLTKVLDAVGWEAQLSASSLTGRALLLSEAAPGARAFLAARMASSAWSQLFLSRSCAIALASLTLVTMRGAPSAMAFWTAFPSMLVLVRQVGNIRCGTMLSVTLSTSGLRGQVCNQNGRSLVCSLRFFPSIRGCNLQPGLAPFRAVDTADDHVQSKSDHVIRQFKERNPYTANFPLGFAPENGPHQVSNFLPKTQEKAIFRATWWGPFNTL